MKARLIVVAMVVGASAVGAGAQIPLAGAPFTATWTWTTDDAGKVVTRREVAARTSDGSMYHASYRDGIPELILINDVPHAKLIDIQPEQRVYRESAAPASKWEGRTIEQWRMDLQRKKAGYTDNGAHGNKTVATPLGVKMVSGLTIYGSHYVRSRGKKITQEEDLWTSDLGFTYFEREFEPEQKRIETRELTGLKLDEPDAALFTIPKGFARGEPGMTNTAVLNNTCTGAPEPWGDIPNVTTGQRDNQCPFPTPNPHTIGPGVRTFSYFSADSFSGVGWMSGPYPRP